MFSEFKLYPNPSADLIDLKFVMEKTGDASICIYDISGRQIEQLFNGNVRKGENLLTFSVNHLSAGSYQLTIVTDEEEIAVKSFIRK